MNNRCFGSQDARPFSNAVVVSHTETGKVKQARATCPVCHRVFPRARVRYQSDGVNTGRQVVVPDHKDTR